jgi:hypothetical protein
MAALLLGKKKSYLHALDRKVSLSEHRGAIYLSAIAPQALADVLEKWLPKEPAASTKQATGKPEEVGLGDL